jgi:uncharacterized membrane protein YjjB (DUF3815 family)
MTGSWWTMHAIHPLDPGITALEAMMYFDMCHFSQFEKEFEFLYVLSKKYKK